MKTLMLGLGIVCLLLLIVHPASAQDAQGAAGDNTATMNQVVDNTDSMPTEQPSDVPAPDADNQSNTTTDGSN